MLKPIVCATFLFATPAMLSAQQVSFSSGWQEQRLQIFNSNEYSFGNSLGIVSEGAVSLVWRALPDSEWNRSSAAWSWQVDQSVPATDLGRKGGDDRNISVYFVFLPEAEARSLQGAPIRRLMGNSAVRILQYAWGGQYGRGALVPSPYAPGQGVTIALRQAGTGSHSETVDLAADYRRAFGGEPLSLVGLAVSGDSDDTGTTIRASLSPITLR